MEEDPYINAISKGKLSLAEALKEIQSVKLAFQKAERIEQKLHFHDSCLQELKTAVASLTTYDYVNIKFQDLSSKLEAIIKKNFEDFTSQQSLQLNEKIGIRDFDSGLSQKVTWMAFNNFAQQMNAVKSRVEKHIMSDFEGFKTKMKIELSKKANEKKPEEEFSFEEIHQLKNRVTSLEQKYHDMFVEEGLDESEDYDSQEEMDGIMEDIDRTAQKEREDEEEEDEEEIVSMRQGIPTPTTQNSDPVKVSFTSPETVTQEEEKREEVSVFPQAEDGKKDTQTENRQEKKDLSKQDEKKDVPKQEEKKDFVKQEEKKDLSNQEDKKEILNQENKKEFSTQEEKKDLPKKEETKDLPKQEEKKESPQPAAQPMPETQESKSKVIPKIVLAETPANDDSPKTPLRAKLEMENLEPAKHARNKGGSSRNDGQTLSRKNSMVSSRSGTNAGGGPGNMRNVNKKLAGLQKELEGYKQALDDSKQTLLEYQEELAKAYDRIAMVRVECQEVEVRRQAMEQSFIKALRRNGIEKKAKAKIAVTNAISAKQMEQIKQKIDEKSKKLVTVNSFVEKIAADTQVMKDTHKNRINEVIQYMKFLDDNRLQLAKECIRLGENLKQLEVEMKGNVAGLKSEVANLQGPIVDLISEQQRENQMLNENIKTQQNLIYEVIESKVPLTPKSRGVRGRSESTTAPDLSVKYKLASAKGGNRRTSAKTNDNWLETIPDGNPLILPRISGRTSPQTANKRKML